MQERKISVLLYFPQAFKHSGDGTMPITDPPASWALSSLQQMAV